MLEIDGVLKETPSDKMVELPPSKPSFRSPAVNVVIEDAEFKKNLEIHKLLKEKQELEKSKKQIELKVNGINEKVLFGWGKIIIGIALVVFSVRLVLTRMGFSSFLENHFMNIVWGGIIILIIGIVLKRFK